MARSRYDEAREDYLAAARRLAEPSIALEDSDPDDWLVQSQEIENALASDIGAGDADVREAAALRLAGFAALDVAVAVDVVRQDGGDAAALAAEPSAFETTLAEIEPLLERSDPALGVRVPYLAAALGDDEDPRAVLRDSAHGAIAAISKDATAIVKASVEGLIDIPHNALFASFGQTVDKWLNAVYDTVGRFVRLAIKALTKAASKLLRVLGRLEGPVRRWLEEKLGEIALDKLVAAASEALLGVNDVRGMVDQRVDGAGNLDGEAAAAAKARLDGLSDRFGRQQKIITTITKLLSKISGWVMKLAPWAPAALAAVYVLVLAYGVAAGGDFLDWTRVPEGGLLDLVDGVSAIVAAAVV
jgi:hypothetical protein